MGYEWLDLALDALDDVEPREAMQVLGSARRWPRAARDPDTGVEVLTVWGRTSTGRGLLVAVRHLDGMDWQIVGARSLRRAEERDLEKWEESR